MSTMPYSRVVYTLSCPSFLSPLSFTPFPAFLSVLPSRPSSSPTFSSPPPTPPLLFYRSANTQQHEQQRERDRRLAAAREQLKRSSSGGMGGAPLTAPLTVVGDKILKSDSIGRRAASVLDAAASQGHGQAQAQGPSAGTNPFADLAAAHPTVHPTVAVAAAGGGAAGGGGAPSRRPLPPGPRPGREAPGREAPGRPVRAAPPVPTTQQPQASQMLQVSPSSQRRALPTPPPESNSTLDPFASVGGGGGGMGGWGERGAAGAAGAVFPATPSPDFIPTAAQQGGGMSGGMNGGMGGGMGGAMGVGMNGHGMNGMAGGDDGSGFFGVAGPNPFDPTPPAPQLDLEE